MDLLTIAKNIADRVDALIASALEANAADYLVTAELREFALAETSICAGGTAGGAIETLLDAAQEQVAIHVARMRMQADDLVKGHGRLPFGVTRHSFGDLCDSCGPSGASPLFASPRDPGATWRDRCRWRPSSRRA